MLRLSTLPFTTNLPFGECDLCWAGREGNPLWPGGGGHFAYNEEKKIRVDAFVSKRELPDLPGGGRWGSYSSLISADQFYFPIYSRTFSLSPTGHSVPGSVLDVVYSFTHGFIAASDRHSPLMDLRVKLDERPGFAALKCDMNCANILASSSGGLRDKILSRVESFVITGAADPLFVKEHSMTRYVEWLKAQGR